MPLILQWQAHQVAADLIELPDSQRLLTATTQFAAASDRISGIAAGYKQALRAERQAAVAQLERAVNRQRRAAAANVDSQQSKLHDFLADVRASVDHAARAVDTQRRAAAADVDSQQVQLRGLLADVRSSLDHAEEAALRLNGAVEQTVGAAEAGARRTVVLAFWLTLALLGCALVGIPLSALLYRRIAKSNRERALPSAFKGR
jgi:hypothetical protein